MHRIASFFSPALWLGPVSLATLLVSGCASISDTRDTVAGENSHDRQDISRAEQVFLYQSRIANDVLDRYPMFEALENADPAVVAAEAAMTESCSLLAQAVLARFAGENVPLGLRLRVMTSIDDCERAARAMDDVLNTVTIADAI